MEINLKYESNQSDQQTSIAKTIATSVSVTNANIFLIADKKSIFLINFQNKHINFLFIWFIVCVLVRVDTISVDIGTTRIICAVEGFKCDSLIPTKYHYVCTSSDDIKVLFSFSLFIWIHKKYTYFKI